MTVEAVSFRVESASVLGGFSRDHRDVELALWCDWSREVLEVVGASFDQALDLERRLQEHAPWTELYALESNRHVIVMDCVDLPHDTVNRNVDAYGCLNLPPLRIRDGWDELTVVSFREGGARDLVESVRRSARRVEVTARRPLEPQALLTSPAGGFANVLGALTDRQLEALLLAEKHGLYDSPRPTTAAAVAKRVGLSRSTFEEHLRKAESRLVRAMLPHLELSARARRKHVHAPAPATGDAKA